MVTRVEYHGVKRAAPAKNIGLNWATIKPFIIVGVIGVGLYFAWKLLSGGALSGLTGQTGGGGGGGGEPSQESKPTLVDSLIAGTGGGTSGNAASAENASGAGTAVGMQSQMANTVLFSGAGQPVGIVNPLSNSGNLLNLVSSGGLITGQSKIGTPMYSGLFGPSLFNVNNPVNQSTYSAILGSTGLKVNATSGSFYNTSRLSPATSVFTIK